MQALNLGNAVALQAQQNNVGIARQQLETNFIIPAVIISTQHIISLVFVVVTLVHLVLSPQ